MWYFVMDTLEIVCMWIKLERCSEYLNALLLVRNERCSQRLNAGYRSSVLECIELDAQHVCNRVRDDPCS
jgi:hypothetical protein